HAPAPTALSPLSLPDALPISTAMSELAPYIEEAYRAVSGTEARLSFAYQSEWGASTDPTVTAGDQAGMLAAAIAAHRRHDVERRSEEHTSELQSRENLVCRLL